MRDIKVVIFDCDGVMFDSQNANVVYYNRILNAFGLPDMTADQFEYSHMHTVDESLAYFFKNAETLRQAQEYRKTNSYLPFIKYMEIEPHLKPLLGSLRPAYNTAIATNRTDTMNRVLLEHGLDEFFDLVVSALDVKQPKPHPESLIKILNHFNIKPGQAIFIGDSELDEMASKDAGIPFVAYDNESLYAAFHINSLKEVERILS